MSFIVRNKRTGHYLQGQGLWTNHLDSALQFNSGLKLVDYIEHGGIHETPEGVEIVILPPRVDQSSGAAAL
jgi:hypothetical protein